LKYKKLQIIFFNIEDNSIPSGCTSRHVSLSDQQFFINPSNRKIYFDDLPQLVTAFQTSEVQPGIPMAVRFQIEACS